MKQVVKYSLFAALGFPAVILLFSVVLELIAYPPPPPVARIPQKAANSSQLSISGKPSAEEIQELRTEIALLRQNVVDLQQEVSRLQRAETMIRAKRIGFREHTYDTYIVDIRETPLQFFWKDSTGNLFGNFQQVKNWVERNNHTLIFLTNAGIFTQSSTPQGLYVEQGKELVPLNVSDGDGNFYLKPNGVFLITKTDAMILESSEYPKLSEPVRAATQSGPLLVIRGKIHPAFKASSGNVNIRSGVGILSPHEVVFAISNEPVTFYDFARLFQEGFNCQDALYLDGAISKMYLPELGRRELEGNFSAMIGVIRARNEQ